MMRQFECREGCTLTQGHLMVVHCGPAFRNLREITISHSYREGKQDSKSYSTNDRVRQFHPLTG